MCGRSFKLASSVIWCQIYTLTKFKVKRTWLEHWGPVFDYLFFLWDLTQAQILLFSRPFVFAGETAPPISSGVQFRFEDVRRLFFQEFIPFIRTESTQAAIASLVPPLENLTQNFRSCTGVLHLANSCIEHIAKFFSDSLSTSCRQKVVFGMVLSQFSFWVRFV